MKCPDLVTIPTVNAIECSVTALMRWYNGSYGAIDSKSRAAAGCGPVCRPG